MPPRGQVAYNEIAERAVDLIAQAMRLKASSKEASEQSDELYMFRLVDWITPRAISIAAHQGIRFCRERVTRVIFRLLDDELLNSNTSLTGTQSVVNNVE